MRCRAQEIYDSIFHRGYLIGLVAGQQRQYYEPVYLPTKSHEATAAGRKDHTIRKALLYEPWLCSLGECLGAGVRPPEGICLETCSIYHVFLAVVGSNHVSLALSHSGLCLCTESHPRSFLRNLEATSGFSKSQPWFRCNLSCHILNFKRLNRCRMVITKVFQERQIVTKRVM